MQGQKTDATLRILCIVQMLIIFAAIAICTLVVEKSRTADHRAFMLLKAHQDQLLLDHSTLQLMIAQGEDESTVPAEFIALSSSYAERRKLQEEAVRQWEFDRENYVDRKPLQVTLPETPKW